MRSVPMWVALMLTACGTVSSEPASPTAPPSPASSVRMPLGHLLPWQANVAQVPERRVGAAITAPGYEHVVVQGQPGWVYELIFADPPEASDPGPASVDEPPGVPPSVDVELSGPLTTSGDSCCDCLEPDQSE